MDEGTAGEAAAARARYAAGAVWLHWITAALILVQVFLGWRMGGDRSAEGFAVFQLHKSIGITILLLTLARIGWRLTHRPPASTAHGWEHALARGVHTLFYLLLLALPLSGWLIVSVSPTNIPTILYGLVPWPGLPGTGGLDAGARAALHEGGEAVHGLLVWVVLGALALHVAGALKHQWIDRDGSIGRMMPGATRMFDWRLGAVLAGAAGAAAFGAFFVPPLPQGQVAAIEAGPPEAEPEELVLVAREAPPPLAVPTPVASATPEAEKLEKPAAAELDPAGELAQWRVQPGGRLGFATRWSGQALTGRFTDWSADIRFGTAALDQSRVTVTVRTGSAVTGQSQPDGALPGEQWFWSDRFPTATFTADRFRHLGGERYEAAGTLAIRDVRRPATLPFTLAIEDGTARMTGELAIDRTAFGVGWDATADVPAEVTVTVELVAEREG